MDQHDNPSLQAILFSDESYRDEHTQQCMCCDQLYQWQTGHGCCRQTFLSHSLSIHCWVRRKKQRFKQTLLRDVLAISCAESLSESAAY